MADTAAAVCTVAERLVEANIDASDMSRELSTWFNLAAVPCAR